VKIVASEMPDEGGSPEQRLRFAFRIEDGEREGTEFSHAFKIISADESTQTEGQAVWAQLRHATHVLEPEDTSDLHERSLLAIVGQVGRIEYAAA
jgi:hypothetical protein